MAITFPASPSDGDVFTNATTGVKYIYNAADGVWKTHVWPTNTDYLQLSGGTLTGNLSLGTNDLTAQDITASGAISANSISTTAGLTVGNGLTVSDGNVVMANGHGIDFSATADPGTSTESELFSDYEHGRWSPICTLGAASITHSRAYYIKVGDVCTISAAISSVTTPNGSAFSIGNLPYAGNTSIQMGPAAATTGYESVGAVMVGGPSLPANAFQLVSYFYAGTNAVQFYWSKNGTGWAPASGTEMPSTTIFTVSYLTA